MQTTNLLLKKLIRMTIETGTLTGKSTCSHCLLLTEEAPLLAIIATIHLCLFLALPNKPYHSVPARILGKIYSNTALATLNSRLKITGGRDTAVQSQTDDSISMFSSATTRSVGRVPHKQPMNVSLSMEVPQEVSPVGLLL